VCVADEGRVLHSARLQRGHCSTHLFGQNRCWKVPQVELEFPIFIGTVDIDLDGDRHVHRHGSSHSGHVKGLDDDEIVIPVGLR